MVGFLTVIFSTKDLTSSFRVWTLDGRIFLSTSLLQKLDIATAFAVVRALRGLQTVSRCCFSPIG
jgi:hypothetical protein